MDALNTHLSGASHGLAKSFDHARHALAHRGAHGVDAAREFGDELLGNARRMGRTTQGMIVERPLQAMLIVGAAAFTLGWIARRARELRGSRVARSTARAAARSKTASRVRKAVE